MFLALLVVTFVISVLVSLLVVQLFTGPIGRIPRRIIADEISDAWVKYIKFGLYVVGISGGVRIGELERYITRPPLPNAEIVTLTPEALEVYRTIIGVLQGLAGVLLVFFIVALPCLCDRAHRREQARRVLTLVILTSSAIGYPSRPAQPTRSDRN